MRPSPPLRHDGRMTTPWPGDSATVVKWVRSALKQMTSDGDVSISGIDRIKVSADLVDTDLNHLTLDATGVKLKFDVNESDATAPTSAAVPSEPEMPEPARRETGIAKEFRFVARPMRIQRTPVTLDLRLYDIPINWLTFTEPTDAAVPDSLHVLMPDEDLESVRGTFHASVRTTEVAPLVTSVMRPLLKEGGVHLGRVRLDVTQDSGDGIRVTAYAGLRWKLLMASARAEARIEVTRDAVITIRDLILGSRNLFVKFALLFARKYVQEMIGQTIDLNAQLAEDGTSMRIHDLRIETGSQLTVSARFS